MITMTTSVHFTTARAGRKRLHVTAAPLKPALQGRIPRVSKLMALAIRFDRMLRNGEVADLTELAALAKVSQPRMTRIMNLNYLAPDIQEALLLLPAVEQGRDNIHERMLRPIVAQLRWANQRRLWRRTSAADRATHGARDHIKRITRARRYPSSS